MFDNPKITARAIRLHMRPMMVSLSEPVTPRLNDATIAAIHTKRITPKRITPKGSSGAPVVL